VQCYEILGDCAVSDHLPVTLSLEIISKVFQGSRFMVNSSLFEDKEVVDQLHNTWCRFPSTLGFFDKLRRLIKWYKLLYKGKAQEHIIKEADLH
jgi:hypothetical protein